PFPLLPSKYWMCAKSIDPGRGFDRTIRTLSRPGTVNRVRSLTPSLRRTIEIQRFKATNGDSTQRGRLALFAHSRAQKLSQPNFAHFSNAEYSGKDDNVGPMTSHNRKRSPSSPTSALVRSRVARSVLFGGATQSSRLAPAAASKGHRMASAQAS